MDASLVGSFSCPRTVLSSQAELSAEDRDVEALARKEEAIMRRKPSHRSSLATLNDLALTDAYFDLSGGACAPVSFEHLGHAVSRLVREQFDGSRSLAERAAAESLTRLLGIRDLDSWTRDEKRALRRWAPLLVLAPGLAAWPATRMRALSAAIRARGGQSEFDYVRRINRVAGLQDELHAIGAGYLADI